jgi:hypothetical protein
MQELVQKFQKMSAAQLVNKMEKGVENETEKKIIIGILQKRGRDVTPYTGKSTEEIVAEAKLDQRQKAEAERTIKKEKIKIAVEKSTASQKKAKEIYFEHEVFKKGTKVRILNKSSKVEIGDTATTVKVGHYEGKPESPFIYVKLDKDGSVCSRNLPFVELVGE